ncbi:GAF domain-containing protein [Phycicoccus sp. CMS6Z-2]|nr:GAF domain-containing protein [Phycicoccus flavus]
MDADDVQRLLDRQTEVLELIAAAAPLRRVLDLLLGALEGLMPGASCSVLLLDRTRGTLHHGAAPSLPATYCAAIDGMAIGEGAGSCGTAAALDVAVVARDVRSDPRWTDYRHLAESAGLRACWSTPIEGRDGRPVGTFAVYHGRPHRPSHREQLLVDRFTHLASVAIDHAGVLGALVESEGRFRRTFDDNALGMAIVGPDRVVARSNTALSALVGGGDDLVGRPLGEVLAPVRGTLGSRLDDLDADALGITHPAPLVFEGRVLREGGQDVEAEVTVSLLPGQDGGAAQYVVNVFDLTERRAADRDRRARLAAETARRTAEEHAHARSEMLAAVGHEARTPMQAIVGFAELLGTMDLDEARRREALGHIGAAAGHVMDLLTDVLDLSRLEAGALPLALEPVCLSEVVDEVFALLSRAADGRGTRLSHDLGDDVVRADRRRLRQVLLNLVGNAVRHGRPGGRVRVRSWAAPDAGALCVAVEDDGPGMPPDFLPHAFTSFARARSGPATALGCDAAEEGTGLGLGLALGLMAAMGGDLSVASSGPDGTSMVLRVPRAPGRRGR